MSTLRNIVISGDMVVGRIKRMEMTTSCPHQKIMIMYIVGKVDSNQVALIITATTQGIIIFLYLKGGALMYTIAINLCHDVLLM